jgi:hypothetical protein
MGFGADLSAQKLSFIASVDKTAMRPNERITFTLQINGRNPNGQYEMPAGIESDFRIAGGPNRSSRSSVVNGKITAKISVSYVLIPKRSGSLTIAATSLTTKSGDVYKSKPITIEVSDSPSASATKQFIAKLKFSKTTVYEGEPVVAIYDLYNRYDDLVFVDENIPSPNGFIVKEIEMKGNPFGNPKAIVQNGLRYDLYHLKKEVLVPQQSGTMKIEGFMLEGHVNNQRGWGGQILSYGKKKTFNSNAVTLIVKPLPANAPASFNGAVGAFEMKSEISETTLPAHKSITLTITVKGEGNLSLIPVPKLNFPPSFETYDPKVTNDISVSTSGIRGSRTFEFLIIPRTPGQYKVDAFEFSYFDPELENYRTRSSSPLEFNIAVGEGDDANAVYIPPTQDDIQVLASDIRHIKTDDPQLREKNKQFFGTVTHWVGLGSPVAAFFLLLVLRGRIKVERDEDDVRRKKASKAAAKHLAKAKAALASNDGTFYDEVFRALYGYLGDKINMQASELSKVNIKQVLVERGSSEATADELKELLDACELAKYTPVDELSKQAAFETAGSIIQQLEGSLT